VILTQSAIPVFRSDKFSPKTRHDLIPPTVVGHKTTE
jgi:hypothetical protein